MTAAFTIEESIDSFDTSEFRENLAAVTDVAVDQITLSISASNLTFSVAIVTNNELAAAVAAGSISGASMEVLSTALGVPVLSVSEPQVSQAVYNAPLPSQILSPGKRTLLRRAAPLHYNAALDAYNAWEITLPEAPLAEAAAIFDRCGLSQRFHELRGHPTRRYGPLRPSDGAPERFFAVRAGTVAEGAPGWHSDVHWISTDDEATHRT